MNYFSFFLILINIQQIPSNEKISNYRIADDSIVTADLSGIYIYATSKVDPNDLQHLIDNTPYILDKKRNLNNLQSYNQILSAPDFNEIIVQFTMKYKSGYIFIEKDYIADTVNRKKLISIISPFGYTAEKAENDPFFSIYKNVKFIDPTSSEWFTPKSFGRGYSQIEIVSKLIKKISEDNVIHLENNIDNDLDLILYPNKEFSGLWEKIEFVRSNGNLIQIQEVESIELVDGLPFPLFLKRQWFKDEGGLRATFECHVEKVSLNHEIDDIFFDLQQYANENNLEIKGDKDGLKLGWSFFEKDK